MAASERHGAAALARHELAESSEVRLLSRISLAWMTVVGAAALALGVALGSVALAGFGIFSAIAGLASPARAQRPLGLCFLLLAPLIAIEATRDLLTGSHPDTSWAAIALALAALAAVPLLGRAKRHVGMRLDPATPALAVSVALVGNAAFGAWWLDPVMAFVIAGVAMNEGRALWQGEDCGC